MAVLSTSSADLVDLDPLLLPFVQAADEEMARAALGDLLAVHASPLVRRIVARQLGSSSRASRAEADQEDVHATVLLRLTAQCWTLRRGGAPSGIASLTAYVATITYNTCHEWLRARAPRRTRMQNRIRYVLTRDERLVLWEVADRDWWCGLRSATAGISVRAYDEVLRCVQRHWAAAARAAGDGAGVSDSPRAMIALVQGTLAELGAPCRFSDLVSAVAETLGEIDDDRRGGSGGLRLVRSRDESGGPDDPAEQVQDTGASPADTLEHREYLSRLWSEIVLLPPRQRIALLFNLRDEHGGGMLALFPVTGIASMRDIGRALDLSAAQLGELWPTFPRDDQWIADYLGLTRRQVINLRKSARMRLARRMAALDAATARSTARPEEMLEGR